MKSVHFRMSDEIMQCLYDAAEHSTTGEKAGSMVERILRADPEIEAARIRLGITLPQRAGRGRPKKPPVD